MCPVQPTEKTKDAPRVHTLCTGLDSILLIQNTVLVIKSKNFLLWKRQDTMKRATTKAKRRPKLFSMQSCVRVLDEK